MSYSSSPYLGPYLDAYLVGCGGCVGPSESRRRGRGEDLPQLWAGGAFEAGLLESGTAKQHSSSRVSTEGSRVAGGDLIIGVGGWGMEGMGHDLTL